MDTPTPPQPTAAPPASMRTYFAYGAVALLVISLALQLQSLPLVGSVSLSRMGGLNLIIVLAAILAGAGVYLKRLPLVTTAGAVVVGAMLLFVLRYSAMKHAGDGSRDPFATLAQGLLGLAHLDWGIAVVFAAGVALIVAGVLREDAPTMPELFAANRRIFGIAGAGLGVIYLLTLIA